jgi:hypothetical protein
MTLDNLALIDKILEEHHSIRRHVKLAGDTLSDWEALISLQSAKADWISDESGGLSEKLERLQKAISSLGDGLNNHFALEEKGLPQLLGTLLMRAIMLDHRVIQKEIDRARSNVADHSLLLSSQEELAATKSEIEQAINSVGQLVVKHAAEEEVILGMLRRALQDKQRNNR